MDQLLSSVGGLLEKNASQGVRSDRVADETRQSIDTLSTVSNLSFNSMAFSERGGERRETVDAEELEKMDLEEDLTMKTDGSSINTMELVNGIAAIAPASAVSLKSPVKTGNGSNKSPMSSKKKSSSRSKSSKNDTTTPPRRSSRLSGEGVQVILSSLFTDLSLYQPIYPSSYLSFLSCHTPKHLNLITCIIFYSLTLFQSTPSTADGSSLNLSTLLGGIKDGGLKSCMSGRKQSGRKSNVVFGSPKAMEFVRDSATDSFTPMSRAAAKANFPVHIVATHEEEGGEDENTSENR